MRRWRACRAEGVGDYVAPRPPPPSNAPTADQAEYDRYLRLVQRFRALGWDNSVLHEASPFKVVDPGFNAILIRSAEDLAALADALDEPEIGRAARAQADRGRAALEDLWHEGLGQYAPYDRATGAPVASASLGGLLPLFALAPGEPRAAALMRRLDQLAGRTA